MSVAATVVSLSGEAFARAANGSMRRLANGDKIQQGEVVITSAGAQVNLTTADGQSMTVGSQESFTFGPETTRGTAPSAAEAAVAGTPAVAAAPGELNVEQLLEQEAAAAGLGGGGENGGNSFVRLLRVTEELSPLAYEFPNPAEGELFPSLGAEGNNGYPSAGDLTIALDEDDIHYERGEDVRFVSWFDEFSADVGIPAGYYDNGNSDVAPGDDVPDPTPTMMVGTLNFSYGPDGVGDLQFNLPTLDLTSSGQEIHYWVSDDGHDLVGYINLGYQQPSGDNYEVFRIADGSYVKVIFSAEITDVAGGEFAFTLYGPLDHPDTTTEDNLILPFSFTVTDSNGDSVNGTLTVNVDDDSPVLLGGGSGDGEGEYGNVVNGTIYRADAIGEYGGAVIGNTLDTWKFTVNEAGTVTFDVLAREYTGWPGTAVDVNHDGELAGLPDSQIWVFRVNNDGSLGESIQYNDDGGSAGYGDGSIHGYDSYLSLHLEVGNYAVVIGPLWFSEAEARSGVTAHDYLNLSYGEDGGNDHADYQITFSGNVTVTAGPGTYSEPGDTVRVEEETAPALVGNDEDEGLYYTASGTIVDDVAWGADGFGAATKVTVGTGEDATSFDVPQYGSVMIYFDANGQVITGEDATPALQMEVWSNGEYTVTVVGAMHHTGEDEDTLQLPAIAVTGVDGDGDPVDVPIRISVQDDVPVMTGEDSSIRVDEDDIRTNLSLGTSTNDGNWDGSFTGPAGWGGPGPANASGTLLGLVSFGADGPAAGGGFSLSSGFNGLYGQNLTSNGQELDYRVVDNTLQGYVAAGEDAAERVVFTLELNGNGSYTFSLYDQLDHGWGEDQNTLSIDLSSAVVATDGDGDSITLSGNFMVNVTDDIPHVDSRHNETVQLEDDDLPPFGIEGGIGDDAAPQHATGTLNHTYGADEAGGTLLLAGASLPNGQGFSYQLASDGLSLTIYQVQGEGDPVAVLRVALDDASSGDYVVTQLHNILHPALNSQYGDNTENNVEFTVSYRVTDGDGDTANGSFKINVDDDMPSVSLNGPTWVYEDGVDINGTWSASIGADQPGVVKVVVNGREYNIGEEISVTEGRQAVGTLTVNTNGTWTFNPNPNLDNDYDTTFSFSIKATDRDGDTVSDSQTIWVKDGTNPTGGGSITLTLDEEALGNANATGTNPASGAEQDTDNTLTFTAGSDNLSSFSFSNDLSGLLRNTDSAGSPTNDLTWVRTSATQITGYFAGTSNVAITLTLSAPASIAYGTSGTVSVTATLSDNLKHALANGEQTLDLGSVRVYAADHDGDSTYGTVNLTVTDDVPVSYGEGQGGDYITVEEESVPGIGGNDEADGYTYYQTGTITDNVNWGADGFGKVTGVSDGTNSGVYDDKTGTYTIETGVYKMVVEEDGDYTFTLKDNIAHPSLDGQYGDNTENWASLLANGFTVSAQDYDGDPVAGGIKVNVGVVDDIPVAYDDKVSSVEGGQQGGTSDVVLIIDRSGSMNGQLLTDVKAAVADLFNSGKVHSVFLVSFGEGVNVHNGGAWYTNLTDALNAVNALSASGPGTGGTDYDAALRGVMDNFTAPPAGGSQLVSMFLSDGEPNETDGTGSTGIDEDDTNGNPAPGGEETDWINFLTANGFDESFAFGFGGLSNADKAYLEPIAWTGAGETADNPYDADNATQAATDPNVIIVDDTSDLGDALIGVIVTPTIEGYVVNGGLGGNDLPGADGWDNPTVVSATYGGDTYAFANNTDSHTFDLGEGGSVTMWGNGKYSFTPGADVKDDVTKEVSYIVQDADGDETGATLYLTTTDRSEVSATDDTATATEGYWQQSGSETISVQSHVPASWSSSASEHTLSGTITADPGEPYWSKWSGWHYPAPDSETTSGFAISANAGHPATIEFDIHVQGFQSGDQVKVELLRNGVAVQDTGFIAASVNNYTFNVTQDGTYSLRLTADDNSTNGNLNTWVDGVNYTSFTYTPESTTTVNVIAPDLAWVNGTGASGNVMGNDSPGSEGAKVTMVNATVIAALGYTSVVGAYGTLSINADGDYTYTPNPTDNLAGIQDVFSYKLEQPDGDTATANLTVSFTDHDYNPSSSGNTFLGDEDGNNTLTGDGSSEVLYGAAGNDTLIGNDANDHLVGATGDDNLQGGNGSDILEGGMGNDTLTGGALLATDAFVWKLGETGTDHVTDFKLATAAQGGDILDLSDLLTGEHANAANLDTYLNFSAGTGADAGKAVITVDANAGGAGGTGQTIVLDNVTYAELQTYAGGTSDADIINKLLSGGNLKTDV